MNSRAFRFTEEQRQRLLTCWKRPGDKKAASEFIKFSELLIADWLVENQQSPKTSIRNQIAQASNIRGKAKDLLIALDDLPNDVAAFINVGWLRERYGESYFEQHSEACRKDRENNSPKRIVARAFLQAFYPKNETETFQSEFSKLPPNFEQSTVEVSDYLRALIVAAGDMATILRDSKQWHNKEAEKDLLLSLAICYADNFGKPPSAANKGKTGSESPFRKFLADLEDMFEWNFGTPLIREVVDTVRIHSPTGYNN